MIGAFLNYLNKVLLYLNAINLLRLFWFIFHISQYIPNSTRLSLEVTSRINMCRINNVALQCRIIGNWLIQLFSELLGHWLPKTYFIIPCYDSASNMILIMSYYSTYRCNKEWYSTTHNFPIYRTCRAPAHIITNPCGWLNTKVQYRQFINNGDNSVFR